MQRNTKLLKRNDEARKGIVIAPSKLPRFSLSLRFLLSTSSSTATNVGLGPKIHGTDGKPANSISEAWQVCKERNVNNLRGTFGAVSNI